MITVQQLIDKTGFTPLTPVPEADITSGYVCDMLSWVMARVSCGTAWVTVQSHVNVVAVAALTGCACVIVPDNIEVSAETLAAARNKEVCILSASCTSYGVAVALHDLGVGEVER
jgi:hypothetical protein